MYKGNPDLLHSFFNKNKAQLLYATDDLSKKMKARGGGIQSIELVDKSLLIPNYYQLHLRFKTADAMGANFINSCLESIALKLEQLAKKELESVKNGNGIEVVMSILSNYVPECLVRASVQCPVSDFVPQKGWTGEAFAKKMVQAVEIAKQ